jgi:uncharacterized protein (DUF433 family)
MDHNIDGSDAMSNTAQIAWEECNLVERIPGKQGGVPLIKGTRIPAQQIVEEADLGSPIEEIAENYPSITQDQIKTLIAYADNHKAHSVL